VAIEGNQNRTKQTLLMLELPPSVTITMKQFWVIVLVDEKMTALVNWGFGGKSSM
jgi:hypothetical protein